MNLPFLGRGHRVGAAFFTWSTFVSILLVGLATLPARAQGQSTLTGTVTNEATGRTLEGAKVVLRQTPSREALTDSQGGYRFTDVPAGVVNVIVSYTGLNNVEGPVTVGGSGSTVHNVGLTADIYTLSKFVVSGEREGNAQAITLQRNSDGVRSVVSADAFGSLAGNPADLVARLPGVEGESVGGDIRYVRIRGMNHNLNTISMDGNRMADAGSGGTTREYQFQQIGSDTIERIEVIKSPTPDMDADSIGGAVNMVSKSAFDSSPKRRMSGSVGAIWRAFDPRDEVRRNYTLSYSEVFKEKFGVSFNYGQRAHGSIIDVTSQVHQVLPAGVEGPAYTYLFTTGDFRNKRTRWGGGLRLDYKFSENTRFFINASLNKHDEHANLKNATYSTSQTLASRDAAGNLSATGTILPGFTDSMTDWRPLATSILTIDSQTTHKRGATLHTQIGGVHRYDHLGLNIDYDAYKSKSKAEYPGNKTWDNIVRGIGIRIERKDEPYFPTITQTAGPDITQLSSYTDNIYNIAKMSGWDGLEGASLNLRKRMQTVVPAAIKLGLRVRNQTRDTVNTPYRGTYVGPDGVMGVNPATGINDDNIAQFANPNYELPDTRLSKFPKLPFTASPGRETKGSTYDYVGYNIDTALRETPQHFREDVAFNVMSALVGETHFKEEVSGAYIQGNMTLGQLTVLGGLRVERTEVMGEGALSGITPEERARRAAWVGVVTNEELRRRAIAEFSGRETRTGKYRNVFPGLHFKYELIPGLVTRLSYATNIGRPGIGQLIPRTIVNYDNQSISTSNPSLKPQFANNFDLGAEYYFEPAGTVSAGVFLKEIRQFIYTAGGSIVSPGDDNGFDGQYAGYTFTTQANGGFAKVKGFELNYSQQFAFLPGFWKGLGAYANYTRMDVEGNYGTGNTIGTAAALSPTSEVAGFNPESGNAGVSYIRNGITVRLQFNHVGRYLNTYNVNQSRLLYRRARSVVDIKTNYRINRHFDVYLDVVNVFAEGDRVLEYYGGRPQVMHKMGPQFFFGVNGRL